MQVAPKPKTLLGHYKVLSPNAGIVLATKYTSPINPPNDGKIYINHAGNSRKSLVNGLTRSLKYLRTGYVDLLYVHWWDYTTSIPELMQSLHALVTSGKVLYLGASDMPAWIVAAANTYAQAYCLTPFSVYQGKWNIEERDVERDVLQMCKQFGLSFTAFRVLGGGRYKEDEKPMRESSVHFIRTSNHEQVTALLDDMAKELGATRHQICIAYILKKYARAIPALDLAQTKFSQEHVDRIEKLSPLVMGFPHDIIGRIDDRSNSALLKDAGVLENLMP
ncbi:hypothetical protein RI367_004345 [Sorochytrium milnesiophthora]